MNPLFEHHLSGTDQGLRRDLDCISAGEAEINAAVGKRLNHNAAESGTTAGNAGKRIDLRLRQEETEADGVENFSRHILMLLLSILTGNNARAALADAHRRIGHDTNERGFGNLLFDGGGQHTAHDREYKVLLGIKAGIDVGQQLGGNLRQNSKKHNINTVDKLLEALVGG